MALSNAVCSVKPKRLLLYETRKRLEALGILEKRPKPPKKLPLFDRLERL